MDITAATSPASDWLDALAVCAIAVSGRPVVPVLADAHITLAPNVTVRTFDYEVSVCHSWRADSFNGPLRQMLVPFRLLQRTIRAVSMGNSSAMVTLCHVEILTEAFLLVSANGFDIPIALSHPVDDFPAMPTVGDETVMSVAGEFLADAIKQVAIAASTDDTLPILGAISIETSKANAEVTMMSTNRYCLALSNTAALIYRDASVLLKAKFLAKVVTHAPAEVMVNLHNAVLSREGAFAGTDSGVALSWGTSLGGSTVITSLAVDGEYPKIRTLFAGGGMTVTVNRKAALKAAVTAAQLAKAHAVYGYSAGGMTLRLAGKELRFMPVIEVSDAVAARVDTPPVTVSACDAEDFEIRFNCLYLMPALKSFKGDEITFHISSLIKPMGITDGGQWEPVDAPLAHLIMPVRMPRN